MDKILIGAGFIVFAFILVLAGFILLKKSRAKTDFYIIFILGLVWLVIGLPLRNYILSFFGLYLSGYSFMHRKNWKQNRTVWSKISKSDMRTSLTIMGMIIVLLIAWVYTYYAIAVW